MQIHSGSIHSSKYACFHNILQAQNSICEKSSSRQNRTDYLLLPTGSYVSNRHFTIPSHEASGEDVNGCEATQLMLVSLMTMTTWLMQYDLITLSRKFNKSFKRNTQQHATVSVFGQTIAVARFVVGFFFIPLAYVISL